MLHEWIIKPHSLGAAEVSHIYKSRDNFKEK